ncbi:hypothetical protein CHCC20441_4432 [Bacillus licheniformis]|uniref:Uncharacterized protein n=1 Tax=Bacillus licheniformis TaxID=1402 RepID=A0A8B5Y8R7_BACLI|nr:hypothetical protein B4092_2974 [Bacillus licheniformis]TWN15905.1 hypothetical protein CHCC14564_0470 [Bacillus licheniformis LMG 17339]KYC76329.1 hypothetical protein B4090_3015 [Bacillus licheniformis]KYC80953.1 hypothetical protein B4091_2972 [Bacillus licheniformis]KYC96382.1 hypothetical protein B4164_2827 [Bacillus licheniformis]
MAVVYDTASIYPWLKEILLFLYPLGYKKLTYIFFSFYIPVRV